MAFYLTCFYYFAVDLVVFLVVVNKKALQSNCNAFIFKLPDQVSNLNSSDPESDVLPITPSGIAAAKLTIY
jgi:hypothetical protein